MTKKIRNFFWRYKHIILILYLPIYMAWFLFLESRNDIPHFNVYCRIDDFIPFQEIFIIPYLLWFAYVAAVLVFLFFQTSHLRDFYRCAAALMIGMTTCLIIYTVWPNAQNLRPESFPRNNFLTDLISTLYQNDTNTNVCPSIHVYNSIAVHVGISNSFYFKNKSGWKLVSFILCVLICLSTVFLKQHSFVDGVCAVLLYMAIYMLVYNPFRSSPTANAIASKS